MAASDSSTVLQSSVLVAPVTALEFLGDDWLLSGEGPIFSIFCLHASSTQYASISVLHNCRIHGIRPKLQNKDGHVTVPELVELVIFGGKAVRLINVRPSGLSLEVAGPLLELQDWVLDVSWLRGETGSLLGICLAHNSVLLLEPQSGTLVSLRSCEEVCLLYSALLIGPSWEKSVLVGGTVFNQLVLWRPGGTKGDSQSQVERRLLGHSGVIFSLCYLQSSRWLASASDDRSVRVWNVGLLGADAGCGVESPTCLRVLYGHQARVFCVRLSPGCVFSAGEDGTCLLWEWEGNGKVGRTFKGHKSGGIRALAVSKEGGRVATGGADGGIRAWRLLEETRQVQQSKEGDGQIDLGFSGRGGPKVVRSVGHDAVLVCTDQGEVFLHQDESWQTVWNGGTEFHSYCVMEVVHVQFQDASLWVCAVGNLNGGVQVFVLHHPNSGVLLQTGQGKVHALQWVEGDHLCLLASGAEGLVYRWTVEVDENETGLVLRLEEQKSFLLPPCSKRWLTAAVRLPHGKGSLWVCGDRRGSLLLYRERELGEKSEESSENSEGGSENAQRVWRDENRWPESAANDNAAPISPVNTLYGVHGKQGVTSVCEHQGLLYSTGRDGCVRVLTVCRNTLKVRRVHRASKGMEWLEKVLFLGSEMSALHEVNDRNKQEDSKEEERSRTERAPENGGVGKKERDGLNEEAELKKTMGSQLEDGGCENATEAHFVMVGFHSIQFVLWDPLRREKLFSVPCGGGHRSWAYIASSHTQTLPSSNSLGQGTLIFIKQGAVMASRSLTSTASNVGGHVLKAGLHGRGLSCVCHLGSISKGGTSSEEWEVLVTGGEDTTVTVLAVESRNGTVKVLTVLADHISNVRTLTAVQKEPRREGNDDRRTNTSSSFSTLLFSAGGRAQLQCYRLLIGWDEQVDWPVCQVTQVAGHRLDEQWERRRNRHKTVKMDPETRYMAMAVVHESMEEILLTLACSDGALRLFAVGEDSRKFELLWENFYHQRCVLSVASYSLEDPQGKRHVVLFSGATDGAVALWDLTTVLDSKSKDSWHGPSAPCFSLPVHQSGVNTLVISNEVGQMDKDIITVASGGDDGQLSVIKIRVQLHQKVMFPELLSHWTVALAHAAPLTALSALNCATLVSASPDQRVCVWRVRRDGLRHQATAFTHTADAGGLWAWHKNGSELQSGGCVVVCGQGLQVLKLTARKDLSLCARCSGPRVKSCFLSCIPLLSWLPRYPLRENAFGDLVSGISVGIMHLPQGMAYALLAAVPPVFGLYSSFYPILLYFIFGTSKHISVGTYAVMSVMIGGVTERMAPDSDFMIFNNLSNVSIIDTVARDSQRVKIAAAVTFLSGIFQLLLGLVQFGFVVTYLSEPLVRGYTTGAAIHVMVSQFKYTFGINPKRYSGPLSLIYTVLDVCSLLGQTNIGTLVVSIVTIVGLIIAKEINNLLARKLPVPVPVELFAIIIATVVSWKFDFKTVYDVEVVGTIPSGLQAPVLPAFSMMGSLIGDAFALAIVGYGIAISLGRIFALKYGYKVDSNQELVALGLSNAIGAVFQCFAISCSMSRTMVQISTGGKTQVAGALSALVMLVILLKIGELFEELPKAVLAAIINVNLHGMLKQFADIPILWRSNKVDMLVWVVTFILTVLLNPDLGLAASIAFSMLTVIFRTQLPKYSVLGQVPGTDIYKPAEDYNQVTQIPGLVIFRSSATLYFANAEMYTEHVYEKSGVDVPKLLSHKKKLEAKRLRREKKEAKRAKKQAKGEAAEMSDNEDKHAVAVVMNPEHDQNPDPTIPKAIILDLSPVNFLDTVGVKTLRSLHKDFGDAGIKVFLSGCQYCVTDSLEKGDFFNEKVTKAILFSTVHDAVLHFQGENSQEPKKATWL